MTNIRSTEMIDGVPTCTSTGDPEPADYYPAWLDNLADDAIVEGLK